MSMTTEELETGLKIAKARLIEFKKTHKELRKGYIFERETGGSRSNRQGEEGI